MLGFDDYARAALPARRRARPGARSAAHTPADRRTLLPISPVEAARGRARPVHVPGHAWSPDAPRQRLDDAPVAPSSSPRGATGGAASARSPRSAARSSPAPPDDVVAEAAWLADHGVAELVLVSENSTSYGKDLPGGTPGALERLLPRLAARAGHRPGAGVLPAARRDAPRPARVHRDDARRGAVLRPVVPAREPRGAAPDAPLRRRGRLPRPLRANPRARARGGHPQQRHRRVPRRDRGRPRRAGGVPRRGPAGRRRGVRLLRRGRHRGARAPRQGRPDGGRRARRADHRARRAARGPAGARPGRHRGRGARRGAGRTRTSSAPAGPRTRRPRSTASASSTRGSGARGAGTWSARSSSGARAPTSCVGLRETLARSTLVGSRGCRVRRPG